jgi:hypothetical protein
VLQPPLIMHFSGGLLNTIQSQVELWIPPRIKYH